MCTIVAIYILKSVQFYSAQNLKLIRVQGTIKNEPNSLHSSKSSNNFELVALND